MSFRFREQAANGADNSRAKKGGQLTRFRKEADAGVAAIAVSRYVDRPDRKEKLMSDEDLKAELERLRKENAALKKGASSSIRMKVSEKGALSIYGMGRFPVTLYKEQWLKLLDMAEDIRAFIAAHEGELKAKD